MCNTPLQRAWIGNRKELDLLRAVAEVSGGRENIDVELEDIILALVCTLAMVKRRYDAVSTICRDNTV